MRRKTHTLSRLGELPFPDTVVVAQCRVRQQYASDADATGTCVLDEWVMHVGTVELESINWHAVLSGDSAEHFWFDLDSICSRCERVWIVSADARDVASMLGLWDALADGRAQLSGTDRYSRGDAAGKSESGGNGYVVLEAPPTIISFTYDGSATKYTWLDPANYGADGVARSMLRSYGVLPGYGPAGDAPMVATKIPDLVCSGICDWIGSYLSLVRRLRLGGPAHTAASQAQQAFRTAFMPSRMVIHDSDVALDLERDALYGGRCEARFIGDLYAGPVPTLNVSTERPRLNYRDNLGAIYHLDVNSLYPSVAASLPVPTCLRAVGALAAR